ncbi:DinB family protein [Edaphobacter albus]|uniref:DinB family protein n=1 Tax=Edaphobacter sp. 4G125 TaxID=2763071 RepID=UPI0016461950|nr:DinB family protein [Edaphobacter sp. 4G125]QNI36724.1 DinB family protein [Edaphobacter sp. 4G125]
MSEPALTAHEALAWIDTTASKWRGLLTAHPEILLLPCDINRTSTVAELLQHIVAVELRYAERLLGMPETDYTSVPFDSVDAIYATHDRAMQLYRQALDSGLNWDQKIEFATRSMGQLKASPKTILFHAIFHGIRHYAQLGTLIRQHGHKTDWPGDYLFMGASR